MSGKVLTSIAEERFLAKVSLDETTGCWLWTGAITGVGYGVLSFEGRKYNAHKMAYRHWTGEVPEGLQLDHLCRVRHCVNPAHLEPVTHRENSLRGTGAPARNAVKTHCKHGHEFTPENTRIRPNGWRACRACHNASTRLTDREIREVMDDARRITREAAGGAA
jgi:hypothetical protein